MAELLIRVKDKINEDFYLNCQCTKRGDVIVVCEDGWRWGKDELSLAMYRIVKVPGMPVNDAEHFLAQERNTDPTQPSRTLQRRAFKMDLDHISWPGDFQDYLADDTRLSAAFELKCGAMDFETIRIAKAPMMDPRIFGCSSVVVG